MNGIWEGGWIYSHLEMQLFGARKFVFMLTFWRVPRGPIGHCWPTMFISPPHSLGDLGCCLKTKHGKSYINMQTGQRLCIQETKYLRTCKTLTISIGYYPSLCKIWVQLIPSGYGVAHQKLEKRPLASIEASDRLKHLKDP